MYITRPLSLFKRDPSALRLPPAEGPNSGYLVLRDQEYEQEEKATRTCCFGLCKDTRCKALPFPQDRLLTLRYVEHRGETTVVYCDKTFFFPVLGQPLSSDLYYVVKADGKSEGASFAVPMGKNRNSRGHGYLGRKRKTFSLYKYVQQVGGLPWRVACTENIMYITRPLSLFKRDTSALRLPPAEGPNSGYLVLQDQEYEQEEKATRTCCFGLCKDTRCRALPFPQDRLLTLRYVEHRGETTVVYCDKTFFFPVLGQPLSSDLYYVVKADGKSKGLVHTCSTEENMRTCCFCRCITDVKPKHLNPNDVYQQMNIIDRHHCRFTAASLASDGFPPRFLRRRGWRAYASNLPGNLKLTEANGMNTYLRSRLPDFDFQISRRGSTIVTVGEWYCPFMFIREIGGELANVKDQMKASLFYKMSLEQQWVEIFAAERKGNETRVAVNTNFHIEEALLGGVEAMVDEGKREKDGVVWMRGKNSVGGLTGIGLSVVILEKMGNEQRVNEGEAKEVRVVREFDCNKIDQWTEFGCYVLMERYVLKRADGTVVFTCSFRHPHQIKPKWE